MTRVTLSLGWLLAFVLQAEDWPQFRGPNREGVWHETGILKAFPPPGLKIRWRTPVGPGWSSPVVARGRVYLTDMRLEKPRAWERIRCFKESTGKPLWSHTSTPMLQGDYVYSAKSNGELVCLEASTGKQVWGTTNVTELKFGASIHLTPNGDATFLFTDEGNLILARLDPGGYREISRAHLLEPMAVLGVRKFAWTPPAFANRHVFARNYEELVCASLAAER